MFVCTCVCVTFVNWPERVNVRVHSKELRKNIVARAIVSFRIVTSRRVLSLVLVFVRPSVFLRASYTCLPGVTAKTTEKCCIPLVYTRTGENGRRRTDRGERERGIEQREERCYRSHLRERVIEDCRAWKCQENRSCSVNINGIARCDYFAVAFDRGVSVARTTSPGRVPSQRRRRWRWWRQCFGESQCICAYVRENRVAR